MRTLSLVDWLPPDFGAVGQYALIEARCAAAAGDEVTLVGLSSAAASEEVERFGRGRLHTVRLAARPFDRARAAERALWTVETNTRLAREAAARIGAHDEVRVTGSPPLVPFWIVPLARRAGRAVVERIADFHPECSIAARREAGRPVGVGLRLLLAATRRLRRDVDRFEVLGDCARRRLLAAGIDERRIATVELGAPTPIDRAAEPLAVPDSLARRVVLLYSGNFGVAHDAATFAEGFRRHHAAGSGRVGLWLNASGSKAGPLASELAAAGLPVAHTRPVPLAHLSRLLVTPAAHLVTLGTEFWGYVLPSKIYGCLDSGRDLLYVGPQQSDVHALASARLPGGAYNQIDGGDVEGVARALERIADRALATR